MTEINKINNSSQSIQSIKTNSQNITNFATNQNATSTFNKTNDFVVVNNNPPIISNLLPENPYLQNPFYQSQTLSPSYTPTYLTSENITENKGSNLWKYLLVGGLGLFTGLILGSIMPYSYCLYYPMYYSYYYTPCWYNFGYWW